MKKYRFLIMVLFGLPTFIAAVSFSNERAAGETLTEKSGARRISTLNFRDELIVPAKFASDAARLLENDRARALSLAAADFDEDGMPDLIAGYEAGGKGVLTLRRGRADLLFPSPAQQKAIDEGANLPSPFDAFAAVFEIPAKPDFAFGGDFDADGHFDLIAAQRGDDKIYMLAGDGRGGFSAPQEKRLKGALTALAAGEINRRDGLTDIAAGIAGEVPQLLVLEAPAGAFRAEPEIFDLPEKAGGLAFGQFDNGPETDLAVGGERNLTVIYGRDRKLSFIGDATKVASARVTNQSFDFEIKGLTAVNCGSGDGRCGLAMLGADGAVRFLENEAEIAAGVFSQTNRAGLPLKEITGNPTLTSARVSARGSDDLLILDRSNKQIHIINAPRKNEEQNIERRPVFSLDATDAPVAVLPLRLNKDALSDLVVLRAGQTAPTFFLTAPQAVFTVNSTANEPDMDLTDNVCLTAAGGCTFRAAREQANYCPQPGPNPCGRVDEIRFGLTGDGPFVIDWSPVVSNHTLTIDGYTQPGASANTLANGDDAVLKIQIKGPAGGLGSGVIFNGTNSVVRGLAFSDFCGRAAIILSGVEGAGGHVVEGNFTGTDTAATAHAGCSNSGGVQITSSGNTVGGTPPAARNLFTDNGLGVDFFGGSMTVVQGNFIGTDRTGTQPLGGGGSGVDVNPGSGNTIGGTLPGARNVISGHNTDAGLGVRIQANASNLIQGNYIGTDVTGAAALGNRGAGLSLIGSGITVGGTTPAARNVISANGTTASGDGLQISAANTLVQGNFIGTDATGTIVDPNGVPNSGDELGNRRFGVLTCDGPACGGVTNITIGGSLNGAGNIISGNAADGVVIGNAAENANHLVAGNYIGTDVSGTLARGNGGNGVTDNSTGSTIGGVVAGARNVISANGANGVLINSFRNTRVLGNYIGLQADGVSRLGNAQHGVFGNGSHGASVGGTTGGAGNRIAHNGGDGVRFIGFLRQMAILGNSIYANNLLGIELLDSANSNQPAPVLTGATLSGGSATVAGTLAAAPNTQYRIEFFANHTCDPSGFGEGQTPIGVTSVTTSGGGTANISPTFPFSVQRGNFLTATATDPNGNTSEFSACFRTAAKSFDFEGDGKSDLSIFRPSNGQWWYLKSSDSSAAALQFGSGTDRIAPADYTGDGKTDIAVWRPSTGEWFILRSEDSSFYSFPFGTAGDIPAPADYDGDGRQDAAVFRPSEATWYIAQSSGGTGIVQFGANGDVPVPADFDGDGRADIAIFRPSNGQWWYLRSSDAEVRATQFGSGQDKPVPADFSGDGRADIAFWRPASGEWFILRSEDASFYSIPFGQTGDVPAPADFDGDGRTDIAVFREGIWYLQQSTAGIVIVQFGSAGDRPVPAAYVP